MAPKEKLPVEWFRQIASKTINGDVDIIVNSRSHFSIRGSGYPFGMLLISGFAMKKDALLLACPQFAHGNWRVDGRCVMELMSMVDETS